VASRWYIAAVLDEMMSPSKKIVPEAVRSFVALFQLIEPVLVTQL
jgi:hypothetical protein